MVIATMNSINKKLNNDWKVSKLTWQSLICCMNAHRTSTAVMLVLHDKGLARKNWSLSHKSMLMKQPGSLGWGNTLSPLNIRITEDISGLSIGFSCRHKRPMWMHRNASSMSLYGPLNKHLSISLNALPSFVKVHA